MTGFPPEPSVPCFTQFWEAWGERPSGGYRDCVNVTFQVLCWKQGVSAGQTSSRINVFYDKGRGSFRGKWGICMRGSCEAAHGFWSIVVSCFCCSCCFFYCKIFRCVLLEKRILGEYFSATCFHKPALSFLVHTCQCWLGGELSAWVQSFNYKPFDLS